MSKIHTIRNFPFMNLAKITFATSVLFIIISTLLIFFKGPNYGIDFRGGTEINISVQDSVSVADVRALYTREVKGDVSVTTETGAPDGQQYMKVRLSPDGSEAAMSEAEISALKTQLSATFEKSETRGINAIGGAVSDELISKGLTAVGLTLVAIAIYVWLRFEWVFSIGAIYATLHDIMLTLGIIIITGLTFDLSIVAAILAIIGYSLNDTVVVYDRIREKLAESKITPIEQLIDQAINETLPRTIRTSLTTLIAVGALYIFGGAELKGFSLAMILGIVIGTYSSIFIASPVLNLIGVDREDKPKSTTKFSDLDI